MTVGELCEKLALEPLCMPHPEREVLGGHVGDLLSWVMGRAEEGDAWVTIMSNLNVVAVASLRDVACVILACGARLEEKDMETAKEKEINILTSPLPAFDICCRIGEGLR